MPLDAEYRCVRGLATVSTSLSTMCCGVGMSGLPMPRPMMSAPRARASALSRFTSAKTQGGRRLMRFLLRRQLVDRLLLLLVAEDPAHVGNKLWQLRRQGLRTGGDGKGGPGCGSERHQAGSVLRDRPAS